MLAAWLYSGLLILLYILVIWIISLVIRDSSIVDYFWGPGFVLLTWVNLLRVEGQFIPRHIALTILVTYWGLRLGYHIYRRNRGTGEDKRYARWREKAGPAWWWRSLFKVFLLQGIIMWLVAAPLIATLSSTEPPWMTLIDLFAIALWLVGFYFEAVGDWQLARFKANPINANRVMDHGLWRYTRHPNYFGDAALWWGFYIFALAAGGWWTIFSPLLMSFLLLRVSGVALLEKDLRAKKPAYQDYIRRTSAFLPRPPREV